MELQHFGHEHPLVFIEQRSHESEKVYCSRCGELLSGPSLSCKDCGFYLDKQCAEAPSHMNHPFHREHKLLLGKTPDRRFCYFCPQNCKKFVYYCSCGLRLHIKCALFTYNIAEKKIEEFQHIARIDPLISEKNHNICFACWKPLLGSVYFSPDCGFYLHEKCADLSLEIRHQYLHKEHSLFLQFNPQPLSCKLCQKPPRRGFVYGCLPCKFVLHIECATMPVPPKINNLFHREHPLFLQLEYDGDLHCQICLQTQRKKNVYCCSICKFAIHIECASTPPVFENKNHEHPFHLFRRHYLFTCDACGTSGDYASYICSECSIMVHGKCISLPRIIQFYRHLHPICHTYFLQGKGLGTTKCRICYEEVNTKLGGYFCSECSYVVHVDCVLKKPSLYHVVDSKTMDEAKDLASEHATDRAVKHFSDDHEVTLTEDIKDDKQCDVCLLYILASSYYCSQCDFFLHKDCAKLPIKKHFWYHHCLNLLTLTSGFIFECAICGFESSGFAYACDKCKGRYCIRCALVSDIHMCQGHEHLLPFYPEHKGLCNACGDSTESAYRCKDCNFVLHHKCITLPLKARHKSDEHVFSLTFHDENNYPESHYCDICEETRNPEHWFYHCKICSTSAHPKCALERRAFIKSGSIYTNEDHPHSLTYVQVRDYPECHKCGKLCIDLALDCKTAGCNYIVHWECKKPLPRDGLLFEEPPHERGLENVWNIRELFESVPPSEEPPREAESLSDWMHKKFGQKVTYSIRRAIK